MRINDVEKEAQKFSDENFFFSPLCGDFIFCRLR